LVINKGATAISPTETTPAQSRIISGVFKAFMFSCVKLTAFTIHVATIDASIILKIKVELKCKIRLTAFLVESTALNTRSKLRTVKG
jgi:hypothetical protein